MILSNTHTKTKQKKQGKKVEEIIINIILKTCILAVLLERKRERGRAAETAERLKDSKTKT